MSTNIRRAGSTLHTVCFLALAGIFAAVFHRALSIVIGGSTHVDQYSLILMVVPVSALLIYQDSKKIFAEISFRFVGAVVLLVLGAAIAACRAWVPLSESGSISLDFFSFIALSLAAFFLCYGSAAFRQARFALLFLILMTPLPDEAMHRSMVILQNGSAYAACFLFQVAQIPYVRHGMVLELPKVVIYIAEECSGIRSSLILLLSSLVLGHVFLNSGRSKFLLFLLTLPLTIVKNGIRIFTLASLGMYVNPSFLTGRLHHQGGFVFFGLAFVALWLIIVLFKKTGIDAANIPSGGSPPSVTGTGRPVLQPKLP